MEHRDVLKLIDKTKGFQRVLNGNGHYTVRKSGRIIATVSKSPGDHRSVANSVSQLRRAGLKIPH